MTDRKGVLVRFPPDVLADLDAEAKRTGRARMEVIIERCAASTGKRASPARDPERAKVCGVPGPTGGPSAVAFGPRVYTPGSRLKKR